MSVRSTQQDSPSLRATSAQDLSGFAIFSSGEAGDIHVIAHRMLDEENFALGHRLLGEWLNNHDGAGSDWVHLQFHMAIFELAIGNWEAAYSRFMKDILPVAESSEDAITDAPALLWRLELAAPGPTDLPWEPLRSTALGRMERPSDPFVELHNLLALAGAGDLDSIDKWIQSRDDNSSSRPERLIAHMAMALRAYASQTYQRAATVFQSLVPQLSLVGGSQAQNQLFQQLEHESWQRVSDAIFTPLHARPA